MAKKTKSTSGSQTAVGNDNIQVVGSNNIITRITDFFAGDSKQKLALRYRHAILELVKNTWIKGVLEKSLYNEVLIELGLEERPGAVDHPWDIQVPMPNQANRILPAGTSIINIFYEMNGSMLILGEPGAGKTTMLLEIARTTIARAEQDVNLPIPVILNLSSCSQSEYSIPFWAQLRQVISGFFTFLFNPKSPPKPKQFLNDWLIEELNAKYNIPKSISRSWIASDGLLLLLDGLYEVVVGYRDECVKAINEFRKVHGLMSLVVVSRIINYEELTTQLKLQGAILLQPLTTQQIDEYFERSGVELNILRATVQHDIVLQELMKQPLMLSIMTLAYQAMYQVSKSSKCYKCHLSAGDARLWAVATSVAAICR